MPFPSALTSDQLDSLRGTSTVNPSYAASEYAIFCPNDIVFQCRVNGAPTGASFAQLSWDGATIGAYTDVVAGQTVYVSSTTDLRSAEFIGRTRLVPTSNIFYINETSDSILDNWYITVINDYRVWDRLARQVGATQYKDYSITFVTPPPLIYGLQSAYAGIASGSPEVWTYSFAPSALPITSGATIDVGSWQWIVPSGMTITVGSDTTQNITAEFEAGFAKFVSVQVDDSNGKTGVFHFFVGVAASDLSNVVNLNIVPGGISGDENGWTAGVEAFADIDTMLDNTLVVLFDTEYYNGEQTSILSNVKLVGRIRKETNNTVSDATYSQIKKATLDIEGTLAQFGRIEHLPFTLLNKVTPTKFDEVKNLTLWRAIAYTLFWHSTYLTLHSLTFDSTADTFLYLGIPTQGGNILSVIQDIAVSNNATIESAPQGETRVYRNAVYLTGAQRAALVTVMDGTSQDYINIDSLEVTEVDTTGKIQGSGGFYNSVSGKVTALLSLAPGVAQGIGEGITSFTRQVLQANVTQAVAQSELNTRTGHEYEAKRREGVFLNVSMPPGYNFLIPSRSQWYTWTIPASETTGGRAFTTDDRWQLFSVSYQQDNGTGTKSPVQATFKLETSGTAGQTVTYPPQTQITPIIPVVPVIPPFSTFPPPPDIILPPAPTQDDAPPYLGDPVVSNGNLVNLWTAAQSWVAPDLWYTNTPAWSEDTPNELTKTDEQWVGLGSKGKYQLSNDGTDSVFEFTENGTSPNPIWIATDISGVYTKIRVGSTQGEVYILSNETADRSVLVTFDGLNWLDYTVEYGDESSDRLNVVDHDYGGNDGTGCAVEIDLLSECVITQVQATTHLLNNRPDNASGFTYSLFDSAHVGVGSGGGDFPGLADGTTQMPFLNVPNTIAQYVRFEFAWLNNFGPPNSGWVDDLIVVASGASGSLATRYSTDSGATFATPVSAGDAPGDYGGFDTQKVGTVVMVGADGQVMLAESGGSYGAYGDPMPTGSQPSCIIIPRYKSNGDSNSGSTPDYVVFSNLLTAGNEAAWYVDTAGTVFTDITKVIGGEYGLAVSPDCADNAYKVAGRYSAVLLFDDEIHLITSTTAGSAWTDRGQIADDASMVRYRRGDTAGNQLFIANGVDGIIVSPSHGSNLITTKTVPSDDAVIGLVPFG